MNIDLKNLTIEKAHESLKNGVYTVKDLVNEYLKVIKEKNPTINAYLEIYKDIDDIKEKIEKIFSDENLRILLSEKGIKRVEDFSWEKTAKETLTYILE